MILAGVALLIIGAIMINIEDRPINHWLFFGGIIAMLLGVELVSNDISNINMKKVYKFKPLDNIKLGDYGFGLFVHNDTLYFKESGNGRCFDVSSGDEAVIDKNEKVTALEE